MSVDPSLAGRTFPATPAYDVTPESVAAFARAVATTYAEGDPAPPTFPIVVAFAAMRQLMDDPGVGIDLRHVIHGDQRFVHVRPVRPGDRLTATLTVDSLRQIGDADIIATTSAVTDADGALVSTARATLVHTAPAEAGPGVSTGSVPDVGAALPETTFRVTREDLVAYALASGDDNPIHQDEAVARSVGLPGVIAHGMLTLALAGRAVDGWADAPGRVLELGGKFTRPVVVPDGEGTEVLVRGTVSSVVEAAGEAHDETHVAVALEVTCGGEKVLGNPRAVFRA